MSATPSPTRCSHQVAPRCKLQPRLPRALPRDNHISSHAKPYVLNKGVHRRRRGRSGCSLTAPIDDNLISSPPSTSRQRPKAWPESYDHHASSIIEIVSVLGTRTDSITAKALLLFHRSTSIGSLHLFLIPMVGGESTRRPNGHLNVAVSPRPRPLRVRMPSKSSLLQRKFNTATECTSGIGHSHHLA